MVKYALHIICVLFFQYNISLTDSIFLYHVKDNQGRTPLHLSIIEREQETTERLLSDPRISLRLKDSNGCTVFHTAMQHRNLEAATVLQKRDSSLSLEVEFVFCVAVCLLRIVAAERLRMFISDSKLRGFDNCLRNILLINNT